MKLYFSYENTIFGDYDPRHGSGKAEKRDWVLRSEDGQQVWRVHVWCIDRSEEHAGSMMTAFLDTIPESVELLDEDGFPIQGMN